MTWTLSIINVLTVIAVFPPIARRTVTLVRPERVVAVRAVWTWTRGEAFVFVWQENHTYKLHVSQIYSIWNNFTKAVFSV